MVYEPRFSSEGEPQISGDGLSSQSSSDHPVTPETDTAVYAVTATQEEQTRAHPEMSTSSRASYKTTPLHEPSSLITALCSGALFASSLSAVWLFQGAEGETSVAYRFLFGEGGAHLISQACTIALFCWGVCSTLISLMRLRAERRALKSSLDSLGHTIETPLARLFYEESEWGLSKVSTYVECRSVLEESRERLIERLEGETRGSAAAMWLIPLSGFLGTVIGMSLTIGRFDELFAGASGETVKLIGLTDLAPAIQGLSTAFDTTLLALALVIPLKLAMVLQERQGERLVNELESQVGEPLLISQLSKSEDTQSQAGDERRLEESLARLNEQSVALRRSLIETSDYLVTLREQLSEHAALKSQVSHHQNFEASDRSLTLLKELVTHQAQLGEQVLALREATEAPLMIQRVTKPFGER